MKTFFTILKTLVQDKGSWKFALGVLIGLAFSISAILGTIGVMDGFETAMETNLRRSKGDIYFYSQSGFFTVDELITETLNDIRTPRYTSFVQTEGFAISGEVSKGVLLKGVEADSFYAVTQLKLQVKDGHIAVGKELARKLGVGVGDGITLAFANGNAQFRGLPLLERFEISQIVDHGIYQHDLRMAYLTKSQLQRLLDISDRVNVVALDIGGDDYHTNPSRFKSRIELVAKELRLALPPDFRVRPFWQEFGTLLEAVKIEKLVIGLILQLIVIVSIFNVIAFIIFLNERKARDIFLFKALGMGQKAISGVWYKLMMLLWLSSSVLSIGMVKVFDLGLQKLSLFQLPGDIYYLGRLSLTLELSDYLLVFSLAFVWLMIISYIGLRRLRKLSVLYGLRREFA